MERLRRRTPLNLVAAGFGFGFALEGWIALVDKSSFHVSWAAARGAAAAVLLLALGWSQRKRPSS
jgi:hypothetical protein